MAATAIVEVLAFRPVLMQEKGRLEAKLDEQKELEEYWLEHDDPDHASVCHDVVKCLLDQLDLVHADMEALPTC